MGSRSLVAAVLCVVLGAACKETKKPPPAIVGPGGAGAAKTKAPSLETKTTGGGGGAELSKSPGVHPKLAKAIERFATLERFTLKATEWSSNAAGTPREKSKEAFVDRSTLTITYKKPDALREQGKLERVWLIPRPDVDVFLAGEHDIVRVGRTGVMNLTKVAPSDPDSRSVRIPPEVFAFEDDPIRIAVDNSVGLVEEESFVGALRKVADFCRLSNDPPAEVDDDGEKLQRHRGSATPEQIVDSLIRRRDTDLARYLEAAKKGEEIELRYYMHVTKYAACHVYFDAAGNLRGWDFGRSHDKIAIRVRLGVPEPSIPADAFTYDPKWTKTPLAMKLDDYARAAPLFEDSDVVDEVRDVFLEEWAAALKRNAAPAPEVP